MSTIPPINEQTIRTLVGEQSFQRGQQYFRNDAIFDTRRQGMTLKARCEGSRPEAYRVEVTFNDTGVANAFCSCPIGGYCKHVAALLLTWLDRPEEFIEQPDVDTILERYDKPELIALVKRMLQREPDLESLLPTVGKQRGPVNPEIYLRQVETVFRRSGYEWGAESEIAGELLNIKAVGDGFLQQKDYANAVTVYEAIMKGFLEDVTSYSDEGGDLRSVINDCVEDLRTCLEDVHDDKALREKVIQILFAIFRADVDAGGIGLSDEVPTILLEETTAEERRMIAGWVRKEISGKTDWSSRFRDQWYGRFLLNLEADTLDDEAFLRICRETGRIHDLVDRLLALGRVDEATREAEQGSDYDLLTLANIFVEHGHESVAERLIQERSKRSDDTRLLEWLKNYYKTRKNYTAALECAEALFCKHPNLASLTAYHEMRDLASQLGRWDAVRQRLLDFLSQSQNTSLLIQIALDEGDLDKALELLKAQQKHAQGYQGMYGYRYSPGYGSIALEVAKAAEEKRPREAIEIYQKYAERLIDQRGRENYQTASNYLKRVRELYGRLGENEEWTKYITGLRERNKSLRALKEELAAARL